VLLCFFKGEDTSQHHCAFNVLSCIYAVPYGVVVPSGDETGGTASLALSSLRALHREPVCCFGLAREAHPSRWIRLSSSACRAHVSKVITPWCAMVCAVSMSNGLDGAWLVSGLASVVWQRCFLALLTWFLVFSHRLSYRGLSARLDFLIR